MADTLPVKQGAPTISRLSQRVEETSAEPLEPPSLAPFSGDTREAKTIQQSTRSVSGGAPPTALSPLTVAAGGAVSGTQGDDPEEVAALRAGFEALGPHASDVPVRRFESNTAAWAARWDLLTRSTTGKIDATYFIWAEDVFGYAMLGHLLKKARDGDHVRVMIDATGGAGNTGFRQSGGGADYLQELVNTGNAEAVVYSPIVRRTLRWAVNSPWSSANVAASNHDKILTDGQFSITGGRNMWANSMASPRDGEVVDRDTDIAVESKVVADGLRNAFEVEFYRSGNDRIGPDYFGNWRKRDAALIGAYLMMDQWMNAPVLSPRQRERLRTSETVRDQWVESMVDEVLKALPNEGITREPNGSEMDVLQTLAEELVQYHDTRGSIRGFDRTAGTTIADVAVLDNTSSDHPAVHRGINEGLLTLMAHSQTRVATENPYVVLPEQFVETLADAGRRGVSIMIGTNSPLSSNNRTVQAIFLEEWPDYLARIPNSQIFVGQGDNMLHAKTGVIDNHVSIVGTYNLDLLSAEINSEVSLVVWSRDMATDLFATYQEDFRDKANGVVEYKIEREDDGITPTLKDGRPVVAFGARDHISEELWESYHSDRSLWDRLIQTFPQLKNLRTRPYDPTLDLQASAGAEDDTD